MASATLSPLPLPGLPTTGSFPVRVGGTLKRKFDLLSAPGAAATAAASAGAGGTDGARWRASAGRSGAGGGSAANGVGVGNAAAEYHAIQFGRQPDSVDPSRGSTLETVERLANGAGNKVQVERQSAQGEKFLFTGTHQPSKAATRDCLLVYDPLTGTFTLELLASATVLSYDRSATNAAKRSAGIEVSATPSGGSAGGSGSGSGVGASVVPGALADEPTPLMLPEAGYEDEPEEGEVVPADEDEDAEGSEEHDLDQEQEPEQEQEQEQDSPVNRDTNTSEETYVNADPVDEDGELLEEVAEMEHELEMDADADEDGEEEEHAARGAYEEISIANGYISEESDLLRAEDADGEMDADGDGDGDADADGETEDIDLDADGEPDADADADGEEHDFLWQALHEEGAPSEVEDDPPERATKRRRLSGANATPAPQLPNPNANPNGRSALRPLALPTTARRMSLRSATTQAINAVSSASTLPATGAGVGNGQQFYEDDSDSDSEDEDDEDEDVDAEEEVAGQEEGEGQDGEESDYDFLKDAMEGGAEEGDGDGDGDGEADDDDEDGNGEDSPLARQSSRGRPARNLDHIFDESDDE